MRSRTRIARIWQSCCKLDQIICWSSLIYNTIERLKHERHECDTSDRSATRTTRVRREWKILILITTRVKTCFHISIFIIWQVKDYKERNNFILNTTFVNASFQYQNAFENCATKLDFAMVKAISKSYTLDCYCIVTHINAASFSIKNHFMWKYQHCFSNNYWKLGKIMLNSERIFKVKVRLSWIVFGILLTSAIICFYLSSAWKRDCLISWKLQTSRILRRPF